MFDVIVVGGGPAGLSAALTLGRAVRTTLVLDSGDYRNAPAAEMHNFLTRDGTPPQELRRVAREELACYPTVQIREVAATAAEPASDGGFQVRLSDGGTEHARRLLLATGLVDDLPPIEGLADLWGRGVYHCPYCHGYEVRNHSIAVIGSGPRYAELAVHLRRFSNDVVWCSNGPVEVPEAMLGLLAGHGVAVREEPIARLAARDGHLQAVEFAAGAPLPRQTVFAAGSHGQRSPLPAQLGCDGFDDGTIEVDDFGRTSVPGVYAAGDMARRASFPMPAAAVVAAAASGTIAAVVIDKELLWTDTGLPNPLAAAR